MRYFRSVVGGLVLAMFNARHHLFFRRGIASKFVRSHFNRGSFLAFQQLTEEAFGGTPIAARLEQDVDHIAVLVDGAPEIMLLALDSQEEFIQVPRIAQPTLSPLEGTGVFGTELPTPLSDGFVGDQDPCAFYLLRPPCQH